MVKNFQKGTALENGSLKQEGNKFIIKGNRGNYFLTKKFKQQTLPTANPINQFIYAQLASFTTHVSTEEISLSCLGQRRYIMQSIP